MKLKLSKMIEIKNKKASIQETLIKTILWIVFAAILFSALWYLLKKFT